MAYGAEQSRRPKEEYADVFDALESSVQNYARSFPGMFQTARGCHIWDRDGKKYIDFLSGAGALNYGHNHPALKQALIDYISADGIAHSLDLHTAAKERFLIALRDCVLQPRGLDYRVQFTGPTGTNAVEAAFKLARLVTGRSTIISFTNAFHGVSHGALAATGSRHHRAAAGMPLTGTHVMPFEGYLGEDGDTLAYLEQLISDPSGGLDHPAAVIVETVQGEGGVRAASHAWLQGLAALCRRHEILLIVDDVQAGCGRTGSFFSFEEAGITPDIVTLSKSLSGYGLPLAVVLLRPGLDVWKPGQHNGTFRGNNHAFVTAAAGLETFWQTNAFAARVRRTARHLDARLAAIAETFFPQVTGLRGRGMMRGILCADPDFAARTAARAFAAGLIVERSGPHDEVIKLLPPLTIKKAELDQALDILHAAIAEEAQAAPPVRQIHPSR
ncbi:MAG: diaminobutyrate--2-oxoglutarate transaminase [Alphaproteobacteria bacterium]|nr:MAG: diaminobutyrate--2-oxoglutarate transaminase [Alphaproteobacteria bacterium]